MTLHLTFYFILLLLPFLLIRYRKRRIAGWKKSLQLDKHQVVFQELFQNIDGFKLSLLARTKQDAFEYTYGEIEFIPFVALISLTKPTSNTCFYDLGSGTGKAVIACALVFDMQQYCGIELFKELHEASVSRKESLQQSPEYNERANKISLIQNNFLHEDLSQASLIFINATALIGDTWTALNQKLSTLTKGTIVITTTKSLTSNCFITTHSTKVLMSWGVATAYIHRIF